MNRTFIIETKNTLYCFDADGNGVLRHLYHGKKAKKEDFEVIGERDYNSPSGGLDDIFEEYSVFGSTRYRNTAFKCEYADKCRDSVFKFKSSEQTENRLDVTLLDEAYNIELVLTYEYSLESDIITRYVTVKNKSDGDLILDKIASAEISLPGENAYDITNTIGSWGSEFQLTKEKLKNGTLTFQSVKGITGHTNSPFVAMSQNATEDFGDVYFASLGYGGNFKIEVQRDFRGRTRCIAGISDFDFRYVVKAGEEFTTPKIYFGYYNGFGAMSNDMSRFAVKNILPKSFAEKELPVLYNSWEATTFKVSTEGQKTLAKTAAELGCELFVMDDGWFGARNDDNAGLGDWQVNPEKFPNGIDELIGYVNELGMDFGLWFEPEMVNPDSDLFRAHPDWTYHYDTRVPCLSRNQLVLNLTRDDVKEFVFSSMDEMLKNHNIRYIKWDMNRPFSEIGASNLENQRELWVRHTMAVYEVADRLKAKYPYLQLEACASGGGRGDFGALNHFDMVWTSDNTDPLDRLDIQRGYSFAYPIKTMRAWVTDWNRDSRPVPLAFRFNVSMQGSLSIGSDLTKLTEEEKNEYKKYIALYKEIRHTVQFGDMYRLKNIANDDFYAANYVNENKTEAVVFICASANSLHNKLSKSVKVKGLDENYNYEIDFGKEKSVFSGSFLMNRGLDVNLNGALDSKIWKIKKV